MITNLKRRVAQHLVNFTGWQTDRKIIVIESDDWGSIRMPSKKVYNTLLNKGVPVHKSPYCRYDSLASEEDLYALFDVLTRFKDVNNRYPVITANTVVTNPDFKRIQESGFREYYSELITETFTYYPDHKQSLKLWEEGKDAGLFYPQSHGREHLNVAYWLKLLQNGAYDFQLAFNHYCWGLSNDVYPDMPRSIQAAYDYSMTSGFDSVEESARKGLELFEKIFGYRSESFIASNFIWSSDLNRVLKEEGVRFLQGMKYQKLPCHNGDERKMIRHYLGEKNKDDQYYLIRNCVFEPSLRGSSLDSKEDCLNGISTAFFWKKPAIISSHRLNYIGYLDPQNRARNLKALQELLREIINRWPDVEFMTSDQLGNLIENGNSTKIQQIEYNNEIL